MSRRKERTYIKDYYLSPDSLTLRLVFRLRFTDFHNPCESNKSCLTPLFSPQVRAFLLLRSHFLVQTSSWGFPMSNLRFCLVFTWLGVFLISHLNIVKLETNLTPLDRDIKYSSRLHLRQSLLFCSRAQSYQIDVQSLCYSPSVFFLMIRTIACFWVLASTLRTS